MVWSVGIYISTSSLSNAQYPLSFEHFNPYLSRYNSKCLSAYFFIIKYKLIQSFTKYYAFTHALSLNVLHIPYLNAQTSISDSSEKK